MAKDEKEQTTAVPEEVQRWTARRRRALVVSIIKGETSAQEAARKHGLTVAEVEDWKERFLAAAESGPLGSATYDEAGAFTWCWAAARPNVA
jgi:transposase-like protein